MSKKKSPMMSELGTILQRIRKKKGKTIREVAGEAGMDGGYLSKIEQNKSLPSIKVFEALCRALGVTPWNVLRASELYSKAVTPMLQKTFELFGLDVEKAGE